MGSKMYEFRVDGRLPEQEREAFADLSVEEVPAGLVLRGEVIDESHLHGIIARFRTHGLIIVSALPVHE
ncbi:hypothetical protein [Pseudonocardia sp. DLS-67]